MIAADVTKKYEEKMKEKQDGVVDDEKIRSYIMSIMSEGDSSQVKDKSSTEASASTATAEKKVTINSILRRAKNGRYDPALSIPSPSFEERKTRIKPDGNRVWDPGKEITPNRHVSVLVATAIIAAADDDEDMSTNNERSRTELDSHTNMVVVGRHALVLSNTGRTAEVSPFTPDYDALQKVPIVDAAILYVCPYTNNLYVLITRTYTNNLYVLIMRNALSVPSMKHNLIPPFIMREAGIQVNSTPKIHARDPSVEDHSIYFTDDDFRTPLSLWGVFSYFPTSKPTNQILDKCEEVFLLTPEGQWSPHSDAYARNEESMLDWEGNMVEKRDRMQILLSEVHIDSAMAASAEISQLESKSINKRMEEVDQVYTVEQEERPTWSHIPCEVDEVASVLCSVLPLLDPTTMCSLLSERGDIGRFQSSVGSTNATRSEYLMDELTVETVSGTDSDSSEASDNVQDDFFENVDDPLQVDLDLGPR
jgi:hypothetical protein